MHFMLLGEEFHHFYTKSSAWDNWDHRMQLNQLASVFSHRNPLYLEMWKGVESLICRLISKSFINYESHSLQRWLTKLVLGKWPKEMAFIYFWSIYLWNGIKIIFFSVFYILQASGNDFCEAAPRQKSNNWSFFNFPSQINDPNAQSLLREPKDNICHQLIYR